VEAYVNYVIIKTKHKDDLIVDLEETFASIRAFRMKFNEKRKAMLKKFNDRSTSLARFSSTPRQDILRYKSCYMAF
jgi:lipoate-protein ligase A